MLLVHGDTVLAVEPGAVKSVDDLWATVSGGATPAAILDHLIRNGLSAAPAFVLLGGADPAARTALVRGSSGLSVQGAEGPRVISGAGVSSWVEQVVDSSQGFELRFSPDVASPKLPLVSGVVYASRVMTAGFVEAPAAAAPVIESTLAAPVEEIPEAKKSLSVIEAVSPDPEATLAAETISAVRPESVPEAPTPTPTAQEESSYDHLFGETVFRRTEDAAVREPEADNLISAPPPPAEHELVGDHDGHTVIVTDLAALRARRKAAKAGPAMQPPAPVYYLDLSTGGREVLDQPLVIGRAPSATRVPGGKMPRLVSMNTPNQDISRTHAEVNAEGGTVVVTDLHSSNGTSIVLPGKAAQKLRPGEPATVIVGTVIDLGDGATLTLGELS